MDISHEAMAALPVLTYVGKKFVDDGYDLGRTWVAEYWRKHRPKAIERAEENAASFAKALASEVAIVEQSGPRLELKVSGALDDPEVAGLLQRAFIAAAQTSDTEKHAILARIVGERLASDTETTLSLASKIACDAIAHLNRRHLRILGFQCTLLEIRPSQMPPPNILPEQFQEWLTSWFDGVMAHHRDLSCRLPDLMHLEAVSCIRHTPLITKDLGKVLRFAVAEVLPWDADRFLASETGRLIDRLWRNEKLSEVSLTSVGDLLGIYVFDQLQNCRTTMGDWE